MGTQARRLDHADLMLLTANVLWALNAAMTKFALGRWQPLAFTALRFAVAGLVFGVLVRLREGSLSVRRADLPLIVAAAAVGIFANQLTFVFSVRYTSAANVVLIMATAPLFAALFALLLGHERLVAAHWIALALSIAGVGLVVHGGSGLAGPDMVGDVLAA